RNAALVEVAAPDRIDAEDVTISGQRPVLRKPLGNLGAHSARSRQRFARLSARSVILIRRDGQRREDANDRNDDHELDKGEALLVLVHSFLRGWKSRALSATAMPTRKSPGFREGCRSYVT